MTTASLEAEQVGTWNRRWVVRLDDGAQVEAVLYREHTLCVSSQVGCAVACPFCASGHGGLSRGLSLAELVAQVEAVAAAGHDVQRITLSGVGEPLHNADVSLRFLGWCRAHRLPPSVTTSGGPLPRLRELLAAPHNGVTVSVHAGTEEVRARMVPRGPGLGQLFEVLAEVLPELSRTRQKKVALAYLLCAGDNDDDGELDAFAERAGPLGCSVHLFAMNEVPTSASRPATRERYEAAYARLVGAGLRVRMSSQARTEANGGCGTLVALRRGLAGP